MCILGFVGRCLEGKDLSGERRNSDLVRLSNGGGDQWVCYDIEVSTKL